MFFTIPSSLSMHLIQNFSTDCRHRKLLKENVRTKYSKYWCQTTDIFTHVHTHTHTHTVQNIYSLFVKFFGTKTSPSFTHHMYFALWVCVCVCMNVNKYVRSLAPIFTVFWCVKDELVLVPKNFTNGLYIYIYIMLYTPHMFCTSQPQKKNWTSDQD